MIFVVLICLSVRLSDYLKNKKLICMKLLQEVCLEPRSNRSDFGDDLDYDPDYDPDNTYLHEPFTRGVSRFMDKSIELWEWSVLRSGIRSVIFLMEFFISDWLSSS